MKVSVVIPFHKGIVFLGDCLQSLAEQNFDDMEIILVCDHVEEDMEAFIETYQKKLNIKLLYLVNSNGVAAARNYGITAASGEYIYFLDSDDYIYSDTIQLLVSSAEQSKSDFVYGRMVWTWFKRSTFMAHFQNSENESNGDGEEEENNSSDSDDFSNERGIEKDNSSIDKYHRQVASASEGNSSNKLNEEADFNYDFNMACSYLVSTRKGVRGISVLNILMKRSLLEEKKIRFKEDIRFLSDYPFLLQVLTAAKNFQKQPQAVYIKRNHNDALHMPSLNQLPESKDFNEYADTYEYAKSLIKPNSILRLRLDKKIIDYCVAYYAPKLKVSKKKAVKDQQYQIIHKLISDISLYLLKERKGYERRLLLSFYKGDRNKSVNIVKWHLLRKNIIKVIKNKKALCRVLYTHVFLKKSIKENWVFCESFFGKSYSGSPKYIYEYIATKYPKHFKFVWVIDKKHTKIPYQHVKVKRFSIRYVYYLARCKYYIFNGRQPEWVSKRQGNVFLQTWHGTPLKRLVFDLEDINAATPRYKNQVYKQSRSWDYLIAPNKYSSDIFRRCFMYDKVMLETGYPGNDILHSDDRHLIAEEIKDKIGIPMDKKTILYAPTWRDDEYYTKGRYKFSLKLDLDLLKEKLGPEYVILLRTHYFIADSLNVSKYKGFAFNLSEYDDISELYLISDILITDYSSVFFDFANLKRPMLFFMYDLEKYRDILRGFYIDIEKELPGPILFTTEDIIAAIRNIDSLQIKYKEKYEAFYEKFCTWEDGTASRKVADAVFQIQDFRHLNALQESR